MTVDGRLRWGILGAAKAAANFAQAVDRSEGSSLTAIANRSIEKARAWAQDRPGVQAFGSYQELLESSDVDAVYIPLPPSLHCEWTVNAAEHGKQVLCEKPLARNAAEAQTMIAACRDHGVLLMDAVSWMHLERTGLFRQTLASGSLGTLRSMTAAVSFCLENLRSDEVRMQPEIGGGCLGRLGYDCVRAIQLAFGPTPTKVYATARYRDDVDIGLSAMLWFSDDRLACFQCSFDAVSRQWFEIAGTHGSLVCDDFVQPWKPEKARFWTHDSSGRAVEHAILDCDQDVRMIETFARITAGDPDAEEWAGGSLAAMKVCDAISLSARTDRPVHL